MFVVDTNLLSVVETGTYCGDRLLTNNKVNDKINHIKFRGDDIRMKEKIKILCYECKKCGKMVYFQSNEEYTTQCKTCKNEMKFSGEFNYNPKEGLAAIKNSNFNSKANKNNFDKNIPRCPTCNSTNVEKISFGKKIFGGAMFGLFSSDVRNMMYCKNCEYKW